MNRGCSENRSRRGCGRGGGGGWRGPAAARSIRRRPSSYRDTGSENGRASPRTAPCDRSRGADRLRRALERHPDAVVIVPHLGFDHTAQFEEMLAHFPNLYLDTTMVDGGDFERQPDLAILRRHPDRILYGTDFPNIPYSWDRELRAIRALRLPAGDEEKILAGNALRLFGSQ